MRKGDSDIHVGSIDETGYSLSKGGFFDDDILCAKCDNELGRLDTYAVEFCRQFEAKRQMVNDHMFLVDGVDTDKLVRFAVSVCWRYSISTRPEAEKIKLGQFEGEFQEILFGGRSVISEPALIIWANRSKHNMRKIAFPPTMHRHLGLRHCSMILGGLSFILKIDRRPLPAKAQMLCINGKDRIVSGYKTFDRSFEYHEMIKIANNMSKPKARHPRSRRET